MLALLVSQAAFTGIGEPLAALARPEIRHALLLSALVATAAAGLAILVAVPSAYFLARNPFPGRFLVDTLLDLPLVLSPLAVGFSLLLFFKTDPGSWIQTTSSSSSSKSPASYSHRPSWLSPWPCAR